MPNEKRPRKRQGQAARRAAEEAARRRAARKRQIITAVVVVALGVGLVALLSHGGKKKGKRVATTPTSGSSTSRPGASTSSAPSTPSTQGSNPAAAGIYGTGPCPKADGSSPRTLKFSDPPMRCIDPARHYTATFDTTEGAIEVALDTTTTPGTANNFVVLSRFHYYDGTRIFRTDPSIDIIQGGAPTTESPSDPGPGYTIKDEGSTSRHYQAGDLVMARTSAPNSAGAQYFFVAGPKASALDRQGTYVTFGKVTKGLDVVQKILGLNQQDPSSPLGGHPSRPVTVRRITISES
ncbi:MAG: peptidylprolyl isomerase [Acidimicrobiales bacterium]